MTMPPLSDQSHDTTKPTEAKKPWITPNVQVIAAGQAEVGTRAVGRDGSFTTS